MERDVRRAFAYHVPDGSRVADVADRRRNVAVELEKAI
jgi:hypothetical protein